MGTRLLVASIALLAAACTPKPAVVVPSVPPAVRLAEADALVRAGCLDCLLDARQRYERLRGSPEVSRQASLAAIKTSVLIAAREDDLGLTPGDALAHARALAGESGLAAEAAPFFDFAEAFHSGDPAGSRQSGGELLSRMQFARGPGLLAAEVLRDQAPNDLAAASLWLGLACSPNTRVTLPGREERATVVAPWADVPLVALKNRSACPIPDRTALASMLERDARFLEIDYFLGLSEFSGRERAGAPAKPDLDAAEAHFTRAYAWRQQWPALTLMMALTAEAVEDFERAVDFYALTLELRPGETAAELGKLRMLSYLTRSEEAIAFADEMLAAGHLPGDARYWRAYSELQLERYDDAWDDIEKSKTLLINADVPKLAGIIAINRRDYDNARARLELAIQRRASGCDATYYLQAVLSQQRSWEPAAQTADRAASCLDREMANLTREIAEITAETMPETRKAAQIARRQRQLDTDGRNRVLSLFNAAVANFNLRRLDLARDFAQQVVNDPQLGERAREIVDRATRQ